MAYVWDVFSHILDTTDAQYLCRLRYDRPIWNDAFSLFTSYFHAESTIWKSNLVITAPEDGAGYTTDNKTDCSFVWFFLASVISNHPCWPNGVHENGIPSVNTSSLIMIACRMKHLCKGASATANLIGCVLERYDSSGIVSCMMAFCHMWHCSPNRHK